MCATNKAFYQRIAELTGTPLNNDLVSFRLKSGQKLGKIAGTINGLKQLLDLPETASDTELFLAVETLVLNNETQPTTK